MKTDVSIRNVVNAVNTKGENYIIINGVDKLIPVSVDVAVSIVRQLQLKRDELPKVICGSKIFDYK
jgi:hypothetical protein